MSTTPTFDRAAEILQNELGKVSVTPELGDSTVKPLPVSKVTLATAGSSAADDVQLKTSLDLTLTIPGLDEIGVGNVGHVVVETLAKQVPLIGKHFITEVPPDQKSGEGKKVIRFSKTTDKPDVLVIHLELPKEVKPTDVVKEILALDSGRKVTEQKTEPPVELAKPETSPAPVPTQDEALAETVLKNIDVSSLIQEPPPAEEIASRFKPTPIPTPSESHAANVSKPGAGMALGA